MFLTTLDRYIFGPIIKGSRYMMKYYINIQQELKKTGEKTWKSSCTSAVTRLREKIALVNKYCVIIVLIRIEIHNHILLLCKSDQTYVAYSDRTSPSFKYVTCDTVNRRYSKNIWFVANILFLLLCVGDTIGDDVHYSSVAIFFPIRCHCYSRPAIGTQLYIYIYIDF